MQELLHAHVPVGGGCYLFEQITADEQKRGKVGLRLKHGGSSGQTGGGFDPLAGFFGIDIIPGKSRGVVHSGNGQEGFIPDAGMVSAIVAQHSQRSQPGEQGAGIGAPFTCNSLSDVFIGMGIEINNGAELHFSYRHPKRQIVVFVTVGVEEMVDGIFSAWYDMTVLVFLNPDSF